MTIGPKERSVNTIKTALSSSEGELPGHASGYAPGHFHTAGKLIPVNSLLFEIWFSLHKFQLRCSGSDNPLHSDAMFFHEFPEGYPAYPQQTRRILPASLCGLQNFYNVVTLSESGEIVFSPAGSSGRIFLC